MPGLDYDRISVRLSEAEAKKLAELARETDRTASHVVRILIEQAATLPPETLISLAE
jgi:predicted DNA-binding protein